MLSKMLTRWMSDRHRGLPVVGLQHQCSSRAKEVLHKHPH